MSLRLNMPVHVRQPDWLRRDFPIGSSYKKVSALLKRCRVHTVCQEAQCPNIPDCFSRHTSAFLIMGPRCTRRCLFCAVEHGLPSGIPDTEEPARVADAVESLGLNYVVITSVTRDDLPDGGASFFSCTITEIRKRMPDTLIEVLVPDFQGNWNALQEVLSAHPTVINHNLETVSRLHPIIRPQAEYERSLALLRKARGYAPDVPVKSGLMLGLGETPEEIESTFNDLFSAGCTSLTIGQYLQPTSYHFPVVRFIPPSEFEEWRQSALRMGFMCVASGPFVRSSYHAGEIFAQEINRSFNKTLNLLQANTPRGTYCAL